MYDGLCVCPVHASHPFVVLSCQPAYVCPVLSLPYFVCRTEGMLKLYLLSICQNRPNTTATLCCSYTAVSAYCSGAFAHEVRIVYRLRLVSTTLRLSYCPAF